MIPIRDTVTSKNYPVVNTLIIAVNVLVFFAEVAQGPGFNQFVVTYGLVPAKYSVPGIASHFTLGQQVLPFFTFMFIHGSFWHLLGNMWSLYIFGDNVEDRLGAFRYLAFYILCGLASGISHLLLNWDSQVPTIGASGAIAGVMGAYLLLYPRARVLTLIPIFFIPYFIEVPAFFFLGIWFLLQFLSAVGSQGAHIAWWAHIGGFIFGMFGLVILLAIPRSGLSSKLSRKTSPRLQVIRTTGSPKDSHLYGVITLTPKEAALGVHKLVNIPSGLQKRLVRVSVPPGVREGSILRLSGMGKKGYGNTQGDLYVKVKISPEGK